MGHFLLSKLYGSWASESQDTLQYRQNHSVFTRDLRCRCQREHLTYLKDILALEPTVTVMDTGYIIQNLQSSSGGGQSKKVD